MSKPIYEFEFVTTSADSNQSGLVGDVYWYDTETLENAQPVYYDSTDTYAYWYDGTYWLISTIADVGGVKENAFVATPTSITVTGAGSASSNGVFTGEIVSTYTEFTNTNSHTITYAGGKWTLKDDINVENYEVTTAEVNPPATGWSVVDGSAPAPTLSVSYVENTLNGFGTFSGTLTINDSTIQESWNLAEREVFTSLIAFTQSVERVNAFRGRYPTDKNGDLAGRNIWIINSGGAASAYDPERTYGDNGNWCNALIGAEIAGIFRTRVMAMNFASTVLAWLKSNDNMKETGNVTWCMLTDLPQQPEPIIKGKNLIWEVVIPLQILYLTEGTH